jgi:hypothetical protein
LDHLSFKVIFEPPHPAGRSKRRLAVEALINHRRILSGAALPVDILELVASAIRPGNYFIWTCTCGLPECSGIHKGIKVHYSDTTVKWTNNDAVPNNVNDHEFDKAQYVAAINTLWSDYVAYCKAYKYPKEEPAISWAVNEIEVLESIK